MGLTTVSCKECDEYLYVFLIAAAMGSVFLIIYLLFSIRSIVKIVLGRIYGNYLTKTGFLMMGNSSYIDKSAPYIEQFTHFMILFSNIKLEINSEGTE